MLFNSIDFAIFLPIVFIVYWLIANRRLKLQNSFLVAASYFFYGCWDWRFLSLILISTLVDYFVGRRFLYETNVTKRKLLLWISITTNIGILASFKYFDFFIDNFTAVFSLFGAEISANSLNIILPVGISFYTFQTLSYSIDVYRKKLKPTKDFIAFAAFVSFFPQLVAGPIERATNLLPQFFRNRKFDYDSAVIGMRQILWGLFKKLVVADGCAVYADQIFNNSSDYSGSTLVLGSVFFAIQIYGDFSGYSDIAIGTGRLFGISLTQNFAFPYFARDIAEFWRRWHISLSTWFRDYLYIPLGGSRAGTFMKVRNIFIVFLVAGFWHGANWTFIAWGALNAMFLLPLLLFGNQRKHTDIAARGKLLPTVKEALSIFATFILTLVAWVFFRANNIGHAFNYLSGIFSGSVFSIPEVMPSKTILLIVIFMTIEWLGREQRFALETIGAKWRKPFRWAMYYGITMSIFLLAARSRNFIYFQF